MPIKKNPLPEAEALRERFIYDPDTGKLELRSGTGYAWTESDTGPRVHIGGKTTALASRVVWKIMTGDEPDEIIKYKNRDKFDLRWKNLFVLIPSNDVLRQRKRKNRLRAARAAQQLVDGTA